jgi:hypothetical protein
MLPSLTTFHAARLRLEAQNAMAFRFFRLVGASLVGDLPIQPDFARGE